MADQQTVQQPQQEQQAQPVATVDYQKQFEELNGKYKELESKYAEEAETSKNMDAYFTEDSVAKARATAWLQSKREGKSFEELVKSLETPSVKPQKEKETPVAAAFDEGKLKQLVDRELQSRLEPIYGQNAEREQQQAKADLFKSEPWMDEEKYKEYETRYGKKIDEIATRQLQGMGPFLTQAERQSAIKNAYQAAHGAYAHFSEEELVRIFMPDHRDKFIAEGRRPAPKLPPGMGDSMSVGKAPELLKQLKTKFADVEGNHQAVAKLCEEYSSKLGASPEEVYAMLQ